MAQKLPNVHPGEVLLEEFLKPMGISQNRLAGEISVPPRQINEIVLGKEALSSDTALRLARYFGTSERFWLDCRLISTWKRPRPRARRAGRTLCGASGRL